MNKIHSTRITVLTLAILICFSLSSQTLSPKITFKATEHDFGNIKEDGGKVKTSFEFQNLGQKPLMIQNVTSSCGCTAPFYTKEPIMPGKSGEIVAEFDPINRPGRFIKHVSVYTNATREPVILAIKGNVEKKAPTISDKYPYSFNALRLNKSHLSFLKMDKSEVKDNVINIINTSTDQAVTLDFVNLPNHISMATEPKTLQPGQTGQIYIKYDASKVDDWGFVLNSVFVKQNGKLDYNHKLSVSVTIEEDFSKLSAAEKAQAPNLKFNTTTFNFGNLEEGKKIDHDFVFENTGSKQLIIRKVKASCGCTAITPSKTVLAPGEKSSIKMVFDSKGRTGRQYKTISVITNAPDSPSVTLKIIGTVN